MKFLQVHTFYTRYLTEFYAARPGLEVASFSTQIEALIQDGFGALHIFAPHMKELGYDAKFIIANCSQSQFQWHQEHGSAVIHSDTWMMDIVRQQIETIKPNILYLTDPITFDSHFLKTLSYQPQLMIGWRAASIPPETDWSDFDLIISNWTGTWKIGPKLGAKSVEYFLPGFPLFLADTVKEVTPKWDVVFCGQWTTEHRKRNQLIQSIAKAPLGVRGEFSIGFFIAAVDPDKLPAGIAMNNYGAKWGLEMHHALKSGKIVINAAIDMAQGEGPNMRVFEATGSGAFLLTERYQNLEQFFEPEIEVATFTTEQELIEKIYYYLEHPEEREAIARRGQERCLRDHSIQNRAREFHQLIQRHLNRKLEASAHVQTLLVELNKVSTELRKAQRENKRLRQKLSDIQAVVTAMKSSKFWKLRSQWFNLKSFLVPSPEVKAAQSTQALPKVKVNSPLTETDQVTLIQVFNSKKLIQDWKDSFQIDIASELKNQNNIYLYQCDQTQLKFFIPADVLGSNKLYEQLEKFDWYYMPDKWEYQVALKDLKGCQDVIEIGAGAGYFVQQGLKNGFKIRGIELNQKAVAIAQQNQLPVEILDLEDAAHLYANSFDAVCSFQVLEHVPNPKEFIDWCLQLLKPDGQLIFCVPNSESFLQYQYCLLDMPPHHMLQWSKTTFKSLETIFPVKLERTIYEPLASYHVKGYLYSYHDHFRSQKPLGRILFNRYTLPIYEKLLDAGFNRFLKGQSLYVQFRKI